MSKFQIIFLTVFGLFIIVGLGAFSLFKGKGTGPIPNILIWGTLDKSTFDTFSHSVLTEKKNVYNVIYVQKSVDTFDQALVEALAIKQGPDAILVDQAHILKQSNKILPVPYKTYPDATFRSTFIQEGNLFLQPEGVLAIPFSVDPLVMYWNQDIFSNARIPIPPKYWDQFLTLAPALTQKDGALNITQSAVGLGEYANINHASDIISALMLQSGNPLVSRTNYGYQSLFGTSLGNSTLSSANAVLTFYTQFADPLKDVYTWNRALRNDQTLFLSNKLGVYFGFASEYKELQEKNPNLNFDVTLLPQPRAQQGANSVSTTFGNLFGFAILKSAPAANVSPTYGVISLLTSQTALATWAAATGLPAVRRDALTSDASNAASAVFATSALWAKGWLNPDKPASEGIFKTMIEGITSGRLLFGEAVLNAQSQLQGLLDGVNSRTQ